MSPNESGPSSTSYSAASAMICSSAVAECLEIADRHPVQSVTGRAGLTIDLKATLQLGIVVGAERPGKTTSPTRSAHGQGTRLPARRSSGPNPIPSAVSPLRKVFIIKVLVCRCALSSVNPLAGWGPCGAAFAPFFFEHRLGDRIGQAPRRLDESKHRHDDQEEGEIVEGANLGQRDIQAFRRLWSRASLGRRH